MTSAMRETMWRQPADLRDILADRAPAERAAARLHGLRVVVVGTGTSWHAANQAAWFLRAAGVDAVPMQGMDAALYGTGAGAGDAVVVLSHRNRKRLHGAGQADARAAGLPLVVVGGIARPT
jgi:glucosamine--fructose-6-phosphate aminotransferase (isomerizing)